MKNLEDLPEIELTKLQEEIADALDGYVAILGEDFHSQDKKIQEMIVNSFINGYTVKALQSF